MLSPIPPSHAADEALGDPECAHISISIDPRWGGVGGLPYLNYVGAALQPLRLDVEQNTVTRCVH